MLEDSLWELWDKSYGKQLGLSPEAQAFLRGERADPGTLHGPKLYLNYNDRMIAEARGGECRGLARRMLHIVGLMRSQGIVSFQDDIEASALAGFPMDAVLSTGYLNHIYSGGPMWCFACQLCDHFPEEAARFAGELASLVDRLLRRKRDDRTAALRLTVAGALLLRDPQRHARLLPALERALAGQRDDFAITLLGHVYPLSDALRRRLHDLVAQDLLVSRSLLCGCVDVTAYPELLRQLDLPAYYHDAMIALGDIPCADVPGRLRRLRESDPEAFHAVYDLLMAIRDPGEAFHGLFLLALLLAAGQGQRELGLAGARLLAFMDTIKRYFQNDFRSLAALVGDDALSPADVAVYLTRINNFQYGFGGEVLGAYAALYDFSPHARRLIEALLTATIVQEDWENLASVCGYFIDARAKWLQIPGGESVHTLMEAGVTPEQLMLCYCVSESDSYSRRVGLERATFAALARERRDAAAGFLLHGGAGRSAAGTAAWAALLYDDCGFDDPAPLLELLAGKSKQVRAKSEALLSAREEAVRPQLEERMKRYRGEALLAAQRILRRWDNERKFGADFDFASDAMAVQFCEDNYNAALEKGLRWIPADMLTDIRFAGLDGKAPPIVAKYLLTEYCSMTEPGRLRACDKVAARLHDADWQGALENIYRLWLDEGADAKRKSILLPYCVYAGAPQLIRLRRQIEQWAERSRGALAAYAVGALAMNGGSVALMMVDAIAAKFPNNQVKNAARGAFSLAARSLGVPVDELSDRIVPSLGFSREGELTLDYGPRTFTVCLMPDFSLTITDNEKGRAVKSLPKPGAKDDPVRAEAAKKEFSELKKQMKAVVQAQSVRLQKVLRNGRLWTRGSWNALFVENPVMLRFATGLIWGVYDDKGLVQSFRYMDDGTLNTVEEEEYELPEGARVTLVHPIDLDEPALAAWKQQLEDYEVVQPFAQLTQPVLRLAQGEVENGVVTRYRGRRTTAGRLGGAAKKYAMQRGDVLDAGSYTCLHLVDSALGLGAQINFDCMFMGQEFSDAVPLGDLIFYRPLDESRQPDEIPVDRRVDAQSVPPRFLSSVLAIFDGLFAEMEGGMAE